MSLGIGNSVTKYTPLIEGYNNNYGLLFDGTNDFALAGISGQNPANDTIKLINSDNGFTIAAWCKLNIADSSDSYNESSTHTIISSFANGGYVLEYINKKFSFHLKLVDGSGGFAISKPISDFAMMRNDGDDKRFLHREDGWHFVVATWDGARVKNIYVDGGRDVAGSTGGSGSPDYGSMPEDSDSKKTESAPSGGDYSVKWDSTNKREKIDVIIGATGSINTTTEVTSATGNYWEGYIGDIGIWNKALTDAEITALYNLHRPTDMSVVQTDNLLAYWKMENANSPEELIDSTGNVGAAGVVNGATFVTHAPTTDVSGYPNY